ncbi:shikimate dehydrogenase [Pararobbsia silviterrae]|uniref:Shikimate dehydrogenase (NADP(+)) n=1 Tax=Pararobbsia silviterrae TaxID=1792498 RepID=A0A494XK84_9BURK|nr:shikimate dehydrogenase [Pararobbsia silviterrae]RKP48559.1 shikimate dehydrogenase [Pararobbsia silviterrae]
MNVTASSSDAASAAQVAHRDRYVVIGNPIAHSKSPFIHARFAEQTGEPVAYDRLLAAVDAFEPTVRAFIAQGGRGLNVTVPFKLDAHAFADRLSARAASAGAVNTLKVEADGSVTGDNTDGIGLVRDIEVNLGVALAGTRVLLLGAGGAARGVVLPLIDAGVREVVIVNRTASKAAELAAAFGRTGAVDHAGDAYGARGTVLGGGADIACGAFDVVVNATAGSLGGEVPEYGAHAIAAGTLAYDMMYGAEPTVFMRDAAARGARVADGLGMLVEQAAESFSIWRGVRPDGAPVLAELRALLGAPGDAT